MRTLKAGGADVVLCASNPLSTQDDVAAALVDEYGIGTFAIKGEDNDTYYSHIEAAIDHRPHITMDDGADVIGVLHSASPRAARRRDRRHRGDDDRRDPPAGDGGATASSGSRSSRSTRRARSTSSTTATAPAVDARRHHPRDQLLLAGRVFVVAGYGWCGRGVAMRAKGMGAHVIVTEIDPMRALEAVMDGYQVMPMDEAAKVGDIFVTATGDKSRPPREHFGVMKDGAILANSGHFNVEIDIPALRALADGDAAGARVRRGVHVRGRARVYLLADGRLVNLSAAEGHPAQVMDMSFANQALSAEYIVQNAAELERKVYVVPEDIDDEIARLKLATMGIAIDELTEEQAKYLASWDEGT